MWYYMIVVTGSQNRTWTSYVNGRNDPGALQVEMDIFVGPQHVPSGGAFVTIWGVSLQDIGQASNFNGCKIAVYGGMKAGLPLAQPSQSGLLIQGQIFNAFGNWQGIDQYLCFNIKPCPFTQEEPGNFVFNWVKGTPMGSAIGNTLRTALPAFPQTINISQNLVYSETVTAFFQTLLQFAKFVNDLSSKIIGGTYMGVQILIAQQSVLIYDGSVQSNPKMIAYTDLIGQPTWIGINVISVKTVMRFAIRVGDYVKLPPGQVTSTPESLSQFRDGSTFTGTFFVTQVRHVGSFIEPDANAWCTIYQMALQPPATPAIKRIGT
jgi:hypothetical protein